MYWFCMRIFCMSYMYLREIWMCLFCMWIFYRSYMYLQKVCMCLLRMSYMCLREFCICWFCMGIFFHVLHVSTRIFCMQRLCRVNRTAKATWTSKELGTQKGPGIEKNIKMIAMSETRINLSCNDALKRGGGGVCKPKRWHADTLKGGGGRVDT